MALSKCPKCNNGFFELKSVEARGARYKQNFIQCSSCGTPVGVLGYYDAGSLVKEQAAEIKKLHNEIAAIQSSLHTINENLRRMAHGLR